MQRRHDIDRLRIFAVLLLLPFHVGKVFDVTPYYHLKDAHPSWIVGVFTGFVHLFHMPLFFVVSGWALSASLRRRSATTVLRDRVRRLLVPLVVGCLFIVPPIAWVQHRHLDAGHLALLPFLATYATTFRLFTWSHLWFLAYLFTFTALSLPLMTRFKPSASTPRRVPAGVVWLAVVPLALVQIALRARWPGLQNLYDDWANFCWYVLWLWIGFALATFEELEAAVHRAWRSMLVVGLIAAGAYALVADGPVRMSVRWVLAWSCTAVAGVGLVGAALGFAHERDRAETPLLRYLSDAAFPIYMVHQLAIVAIAVPVTGMHAPIAVKIPILLAGATAATLASYALVVRRAPVVRLAFGMSARPIDHAPAPSKIPGRDASPVSSAAPTRATR